LAATDRQNISVAKQLEIVKSLQVENIPVAVQLILGIPGDTYDLWKTCLTDLMEWGIHDDYWVFSYNLLPNAPAAAKDFVEKWQIKTIERFIPVSPVRKRPKDAPIEDFAMKGRLIVETKSFSRSDWVKMQTFSAFVHALHNRGVTRLIAKYLRFSHNMPYRKFYEDVIDNALGASNLYQSIYQNYQHYLVDEQKSEDMEVDQFKYCLYPSRWLAFQICYHLNSFFADLKEFLTARYPEITNLQSVIEYQKNMIITPAEVGRRKIFSTEFEWAKYFQIQSQYTVYEPQPEPDWAPGTLVEVRDAGENLQDYSSAFSCSDADWNAWVSRMLLTRNAAEKNIFSDVRSFRSAP